MKIHSILKNTSKGFIYRAFQTNCDHKELSKIINTIFKKSKHLLNKHKKN